MATHDNPPDDPLAKKAEEAERLKNFVERTTFAGDQREASDELSMVSQHPADVADMTMQRELDYTIKSIAEEEAGQVQEAIERRAQGQYGICAECGQSIGQERLAARPQATLCIDCQRKREGERQPSAVSTQPVEDA